MSLLGLDLFPSSLVVSPKENVATFSLVDVGTTLFSFNCPVTATWMNDQWRQKLTFLDDDEVESNHKRGTEVTWTWRLRSYQGPGTTGLLFIQDVLHQMLLETILYDIYIVSSGPWWGGEQPQEGDGLSGFLETLWLHVGISVNGTMAGKIGEKFHNLAISNCFPRSRVGQHTGNIRTKIFANNLWSGWTLISLWINLLIWLFAAFDRWTPVEAIRVLLIQAENDKRTDGRNQSFNRSFWCLIDRFDWFDLVPAFILIQTCKVITDEFVKDELDKKLVPYWHRWIW